MNQPRAQHDVPNPGTPVDWQQALALHDRWLRAVVRARLGEWQAVDEVMQEVSLAALAGRAALADATKTAPWLYRVAVRQVLLYRRRHGRRRRLTESFAQCTQPSEADTRTVAPLDWLLADEQGRAVREALEQLRGPDADILLLKYSENWSYAEIAGHLGASHSAVEARLHRARARLRARLTAMNVTEVRT